MAYKVELERRAVKDLKSLSKRQVEIFTEFINEIAESPTSYPKLEGKFEGLRKARKGDYRIVFFTEGDVVKIVRIAHRKDVYR